MQFRRRFPLPLFLFILVSTLASSSVDAAPAQGRRGRDGGASGVGGGMPMEPVRPGIPFRYECVLTWITDQSAGPAAISQARFSLDNDRVAINRADLAWKHGYASSSLDPRQTLGEADAVGKGEALAGTYRPYGAHLEFHYSGMEGVPLTDRRAYRVDLKLSFGVRKGEGSHTTVSVGTDGSLADARIAVLGEVGSNGVGESRLPSSYSLVCTQ